MKPGQRIISMATKYSFSAFGVGVVEPKYCLTAVVLCKPKVNGDRFGVSELSLASDCFLQ